MSGHYLLSRSTGSKKGAANKCFQRGVNLAHCEKRTPFECPASIWIYEGKAPRVQFEEVKTSG